MKEDELTTAREAFRFFSAPSEAGKETAEKMVAKGDTPQAGALAALLKDEEEAIDGYRKVQPLFKDDPEALEMIDGAIRDEIRHGEMAKSLYAKYLFKDEVGEKALKETHENIDKAYEAKEDKPSGEVAKPL